MDKIKHTEIVMDFRHRQPTSHASEKSRHSETVKAEKEEVDETEGGSESSGFPFVVDASEENRLPCSLVVGCLLSVIVVLVMVVGAAVYVPPVREVSDELQWWQTSVIYQVYPRSFKDSNADGTGDISGIISKLDYLRELGIGAIWIGPVYPSPQIDFGYDVTDHCAVDAIYGTLEDMERLIDETHKRGMRVILDFIPNHTSDEHPWFQRSRRQTKTDEDDEEYKDFFIWSNGRQTTNGNTSTERQQRIRRRAFRRRVHTSRHYIPRAPQRHLGRASVQHTHRASVQHIPDYSQRHINRDSQQRIDRTTEQRMRTLDELRNIDSTQHNQSDVLISVYRAYQERIDRESQERIHRASKNASTEPPNIASTAPPTIHPQSLRTTDQRLRTKHQRLRTKHQRLRTKHQRLRTKSLPTTHPQTLPTIHPQRLQQRIHNASNDTSTEPPYNTSTEPPKDTSTKPPNNWRSAFGGSAWSWDEERRQFYFHQFSRHQPDLNYRNPAVFQKMTDVMKFWIEKGVDGFRVDAVDFLVESNDLSLDEPLLRDTTDSKGVGAGAGAKEEEEVDFRQVNHIYTQHQSETHEVFKLWRQFLDEYEQQSGKHIVLLAETFDNSTSMNWWKTFYENGAVDMPFNFYLMERTNDSCIASCFRSVVETLIRNLPKDKWLNWVLGSHDQKRVSTKYGCHFVNVLNMLNLLLPGTAITYQGEEIGMEDIHLTYEETKDPQGKNAGPSLYKTVSRDGSRSPMQWSVAENGGFTSGRETWLPVHPNYVINNVQMQQADPSSTWWQYKRLVDLRRRPAFLSGEVQLNPHPETTEQVFAFVRFAAIGNIHPRYLVIANVGKTPSRIDFSGQKFGQIEIPRTGRIVHLSTPAGSCPNVRSPDSSSSSSTTKSSQYSVNELINLDNVVLDSGEGLVIEFHSL